MKLSADIYSALGSLIKESAVLKKNLSKTDSLTGMAAALASAAMAAGFSIDETMLLSDLEEGARQVSSEQLTDDQLEILAGGGAALVWDDIWRFIEKGLKNMHN